MRTVSGYLLKCGLQIRSVFAIIQAGLVLANGFMYFLKALFLDLWEHSHVQKKPLESRGRGVCSSQEKRNYCTLQVFPPINSMETESVEQRKLILVCISSNIKSRKLGMLLRFKSTNLDPGCAFLVFSL